MLFIFILFFISVEQIKFPRDIFRSSADVTPLCGYLQFVITVWQWVKGVGIRSDCRGRGGAVTAVPGPARVIKD